MASREIELVSAADLAAKLSLEHPFRTSLLDEFAHLEDDVRINWLSGGSIPNMQSHRSAMEALLMSQYRRVIKAFVGSIRARYESKSHIISLDTKVQDVVDAQISGNLLDWARRHAREQANIITDTTVSDLQDIINRVTTTPYQPASTPPSIGAQAIEIVRDFRASIAERIEAIVITETNTAAETAKQAEADELIKSGRVRGEAKKTWVARLDNKTREAHMRADGQTVEYSQLYTVWGERLAYPGDTSNGASIKNVIHCRCSSILTISQ